MLEKLLYGRDGLILDLSGLRTTVLTPRYQEGLPDEASAFREAVRQPVAGRPLRETIRSGERVAVVIADGTRPLPSDRLLPWILDELPQVRPQDLTVIVGTGSHRPNTPAELTAMVGAEIVGQVRIVNHNAHDPATLALAGQSPFGYPVDYNRLYIEADRRILVGFIEPHFMAGFSGGYKAAFPGVAGIGAIMRYHGVENIGDPRSTWGRLEDNPTQAHVRAAGALVPVDFCINVTLNRRRQITRYFCGETMAAHRAGCAWVKEQVMVPCPHDYPVVVTTNSGYPLDQNLYQTIKGISAAAQIVRPGGLILAAAECADGFPEHGNFKRRLFAHASAAEMLETILRPGFSEFDQWQAQLLALILRQARVGLHSQLDPAEVRRAHLEPIADLRAALWAELRRIGTDSPVAVLPEGPLTIPYLTEVG